MVIDQNNHILAYKDLILRIGGTVVANKVCPEYEGLVGKVLEIRTDNDREDAGGASDEVYVEFEVPTDSRRVAKLEADFSKLYRSPKTIDDIALDIVIMAPEMLEVPVTYKKLKNVEERQKFLENYRAWGVWKEVTELNLKYYWYPFSDGSMFIITEYMHPGGQYLPAGEDRKYHLIKDEHGYSSFDPSGCGKTALIDHLTKGKFEVVDYAGWKGDE